MSSDIEEVFSLFFQDFDYKILDTSVNRNKAIAKVSLRLFTLDARALAEDFSKALLKHEMRWLLQMIPRMTRPSPWKTGTCF